MENQPPNATAHPFRIVSRMLLLLILLILGGLFALGIEGSSFADVLATLRARRTVIGLLPGHWQYDSGAVCPDGLQEVMLTVDITHRVARQLRSWGYVVEIFPEFSPRLDGFQGAAFLAIHADSCVDLSGFKIATRFNGQNDDQKERLVEMLAQAYAQATALAPHPYTITPDMREYYALQRISPTTPGAIIEIGFMGGDRYLLTQEPERIAKGIAQGLKAFLQSHPPLEQAP